MRFHKFKGFTSQWENGRPFASMSLCARFPFTAAEAATPKMAHFAPEAARLKVHETALYCKRGHPKSKPDPLKIKHTHPKK